jgi:hypothetical protein
MPGSPFEEISGVAYGPDVVLVLIVVREEDFHQASDEAQQSNSARRCRRFGLHDFKFGIPHGGIGILLLRLDFSISGPLFEFGNCRFLPGQFVVSGLARLITFGAFGVRQMARANSFDKPIELLFILRTKRRREMSVDLLMSYHPLAVECHGIFFLGGMCLVSLSGLPEMSLPL